MERKTRAAKALRIVAPTAIIALALGLTSARIDAQEAVPNASPGDIVAAATGQEWRRIDPADLLVMTLAAQPGKSERRIIIQLMPAPFPQTHIANMRMLAKEHWWDGLAIVRVQDNYVVQWGDPDAENEAAKALPADLQPTSAVDYVTDIENFFADAPVTRIPDLEDLGEAIDQFTREIDAASEPGLPDMADPYAPLAGFRDGWPFASDTEQVWPVHCYAMVGVGRNYPPDAGSGAELYTVIGQAPRHLDRNIAVVGRVIDGIEHLSSLPRGTGALGFYETAPERVTIARIRLASDLPALAMPRFEYLDTDSASFMRYAHARANRRDSFFVRPVGGADICNIPVPVRKVTQ